VGSGTWILSGDNSSTFTGKTTISNGAVQISSEANLGATPGAYVADQLTLGGGSTSGTLKTTATTSLSTSRGVTVAAGGGSFDIAASTTLTVNSIVTGGGALTKEGAGTLLLMASNTNTGTITVNNGILGGTGTVGGDLIVSRGGMVAPGVEAEGRLTLSGALTVSSGGTLLMQLGGATANDAFTIQSQMDSNGNLTGLIGSVPPAWSTYLAGTTLHDNILVNGISAPTINGTLKIDPTFLYGYNPSYGDIFKLIDWTAAGSIAGTTSFDYTGLTLNGLSFNSDLFASNGILVVVPEPSRVLFLMLGLLGLMLRRRRTGAIS
jgi:autotransporter-associated beta strand protein